MTPRTKKLLGMAILLPGLLLYFGLVVNFAEMVPDPWWVKLIYFVVTGVAWAAPVIPFIRWMERE